MRTNLSPSAASAFAGGRETVSLDGKWDFRLEGRDGWRKAHVPNPWQAEFDDLREASGTAVYAREIDLPEGWRGRQIAIRFGAAAELAEVQVDGRLIGAHEGGYLPFECVLPDDLAPGPHRLEVRVSLPDGDRFAETPHGKQSWYGPLGGLWQSVCLQARDRRHVAALRIRAELAGGRVSVEADLSEEMEAVLTAAIVDGDGIAVAAAEMPVSGRHAALQTAVPDMRPWSPDHPELYTLTLRLAVGGEVIDAVSERFGFRSFETRNGSFFLNGEPFYLRGALDQDYYPGSICTPPSTEFLDDQIRKAKALGLNLLRCHIKVPDPRYYEVADRLGMLVWTEIPNVETFSPRAAKRLRDTMQGILARDGNHPSIVAWTLVNEDWGMRLREAPDHREWLAETFDWLKKTDPTRLVVDNSACFPNYHVKTDINDFHYYRSIPERRAEWDRLTEEFAAGAAWTFSPHGDAQWRGDEPLVVSEFGVWGLPFPAKLRNPDGREPWWFADGDLWSDGAANPQGVEHRFASLRLDKVFGSFDAFIEAAQWYQFESLKYEIEAMRAYPSIAGYVVTELTDVHWESNGLMDMTRNPRVFADRFAEINADTVIVPGLERWSFWGGETLALDPRIATGGQPVPAGSRLEWRLGDQSGGEAAPAVAAPQVEAGQPIRIALPSPAQAAMQDLHLRLLGPDGDPLAVNSVRFALYPRLRPLGVSVASDDPALEERFAALGYQTGGEAEADLFVTRRLDAQRIDAIRLGQTVLLLAERGKGHLRHDPPPRDPPFEPIVDDVPGLPSPAYFSFPGYAIANRDGTVWRGDWLANFTWLRRDGVFAALAGGPMIDPSFDRVVPRAVMTGFRAWEFDARVHGGVVVGWLRKPAATLFDKAHGSGRLIATTFRLCEDAPGADPTATVLTDCLVRLAAERRGTAAD